MTGVDVSQETAGRTITEGLQGPQDVVIISAGYFGKESFDEPDWDAEVKMYATSAIGPVFIVHALHKAGLLKKGSKVIIVSSEAGSIALRHETEGGGNFGHHGSKAASNMVGKLLSFDLKDAGVAIGMAHPVWNEGFSPYSEDSHSPCDLGIYEKRNDQKRWFRQVCLTSKIVLLRTMLTMSDFAGSGMMVGQWNQRKARNRSSTGLRRST